MPDFLQIAKPLIERGFSIIPLEPNGKRPVKGIGATARTRYWTQVYQWGQSWPDANVGICADENIVILETDDFTRLNQLVFNGTGKSLGGRGLITGCETLMACGSSKNRPHLFFERTERATNVGNLVVPGLFEARFLNQYVVGPGSVHPDGSVYRFLNDAAVAPIPDWLVSELARLAVNQKVSGDSGRVIKTIDGRVPEGSRHYFLMRELGRLWSGEVSEEELTEKAFELNQLCDPPKDEAHVRQCVRDIMRREPFDPGPKVVLGSATNVLNSGTEEKKTVEQWKSVTADELVAMEIPPRTPIMTEGESVLFYESSVNQILAWRGVGKTNFGLGLAGAMATGGRILNFQADKPRRVLYIDGELPLAQLQERVKSFLAAEYRSNIHLFGPEFIAPPRGLDFIQPHDAEALKALVKAIKPDVLFLDSQSTTMMGDSNKTEFQEGRLRLLRELRWAGLCVIEMHHVGKSQQQRGLSRNDDVLDVQMHLKKIADWEPEDGLQFELVYEKVRHAARLENGYVVALVGNEWTKRPSDELAAAAEMFNAGATVQEVKKKLKISQGKASNLRRRAIKLGLVNTAVETDINGVKSKPKQKGE